MTATATPRAKASWSAAAKRAFRDVIAAHDDLDTASLTAVYTAGEVVSAADKMQDQIDADGLMVAGSMGQLVSHPLISEVRQYRRQAQEILRPLAAAKAAASPASAAASALSQKRWTSRPAAGATVTPIRKSDAPF